MIDCFKLDKKNKNEKLIEEYQEFITQLTKNAEKNNDAKSQLILGIMYQSGNGVTENKEKALEYFKLSAKQGNLIAQRKLALRYLSEGKRNNKEKSNYWMTLSAKQGNSGSINNIAINHLNGFGVEKNSYKSISNFRKAIKLKNANAYNSLGILYLNGEGVPKNLNIAFKLFFKSHYLGSSNGTESLGFYYQYHNNNFHYNHKNTSYKMYNYYLRSAKEENPDAQFALAICSLQGIGVTKSKKRAFQLFQKAAENGNLEAKNSYAICYEKGRGCKQNIEKAFEIYKEAAELNEPNSCYNLGICYFQGKGVDVAYGKAYKWFKRASQFDDFRNLNIIQGISKLQFILTRNGKYEEIEKLLHKGCEINKICEATNQSALHLVCQTSKKTQFQLFQLLIDHGANPYLKNNSNKTPIDLLKAKSDKKMFCCEISIIEDFLNVFQAEELTDLIICNKKVNRFWVEYRIGRRFTFNDHQILSQYSCQEVRQWLKWVYTGMIEDERGIILRISNHLKIRDFQQKTGKCGLINDLRILIQETNSMDFTLIVDQKFLKMHKFIMQTRSNLFRGLFLSVTQIFNQVKDYSKKSYQTLNCLRDFIYSDSFSNNNLINNNKQNIFTLIEDLKDAKEYYQLNKKSKLIDCLHQIKNYCNIN
ncbi:erad-associated e3 ubiquitin-protein ligase component-related [Anaeramoeba flamelloides]|uniref:Erad-associated e3 ubiquitin-protein ligase component-related n=1 Tax=Anaeramoeba flamelloides TaxID=1746091 RepID=A0AAV7Z7V4_9EUKA|nr:erad-associated e3 ubiquitin-protein ligase component-related [Anaeramoeba flamelloides]